MAFDMYHDDPETDPWLNSFEETVQLVDGLAKNITNYLMDMY